MTDADGGAAAVMLEAAAQHAADGDNAAAGSLAVAAAALLPPGHRDRHDALALGAHLLATAGRHDAAADAWAEAAADAGDDATRARDLTGEGEAARLAGAWPRAVAAHERALALASSALGESVETATAAQNLAMTFKYTGRFADAGTLYRRALAIAEAAGEQRLVSVICHNLGGLAHARGDHAAGVPWARRSVRVREALGDDPVGVAADQGALAGLLLEIGELDEAAALLGAARHTFVERLGVDHHEVGVIDGNLAAVALRRGDLDGAERHARAALTVKEVALGAASPELAPTLTTLGTIRRQQGAPAEAEGLHRRALDVLRPVVEADHPLLRTIEDNLAAALRPSTLIPPPGHAWATGGDDHPVT